MGFQCFCKGVSWMVKRWLKVVNTVWDRCKGVGARPIMRFYKGVALVLHICYKGVMGLLFNCYACLTDLRSVTEVIQGYYKCTTLVFHWCYRVVTEVLKGFTGRWQGCSRGVPGFILACYMDVKGGVAVVLQWYYRGVTLVVHGCYRDCYISGKQVLHRFCILLSYFYTYAN